MEIKNIHKEKFIEEIKEFSRKNPVVNKLEEMLIELIDANGFGLFYQKFKKTMCSRNNKNKSAFINELKAAYKLKTISNFNVNFMIEDKISPIEQLKYGSYMIAELPKDIKLKNYPAVKKPDLFWFFHKKIMYCEIKTIKSNPKLTFSLLREEECDIEREKKIVTNKILEKIREALKQIKTFGYGIIYIFCERSYIDFFYLEKEIEKLSK
ncbi:hypothetical protein EOM09_03565 [bacterium]|nr:hypothetical protein [bacterium]